MTSGWRFLTFYFQISLGIIILGWISLGKHQAKA